jgi:hypothetical protein
MSITFIGPSGSCEFPWVQYALLRDNVLHHFERSDVSASFSELHRIAEATGGRRVSASAARLREQIARAQALCILPIAKLAISAWTRAVLFPKSGVLLSGSTELIGPQVSLPWVSGNPQTLGDIFGNVCSGLLEITKYATDSDVVEVIDF